MTPPSIRPITVVVPVFGDEESLRECVESLRRTVDRTTHRVLFVNDVGPAADRIEEYLLAVVAQEGAFRYERNPRNLGFVGTCNRAAAELDLTDNDILFLNSDTITTVGFLEELSSVLHSSPTHGAVCPRSNNATIASLPFARRDPSEARTLERTARVHAALRHELPRYSASPVAMGFCLLIRRELIREYGLFDPVFSPGYGEENDFCLRIAQHGYLSLIAHRALVFHRGGRSFRGVRREILRSRHEGLLLTRYPDYPRLVATYLGRDRDPADVFADALVAAGGGLRVLVDLGDATSFDAAVEELVAMAGHVAREQDVDVTVLAQPRLGRRVARRFAAVSVIGIAPIDRVWDVAVFSSAELSFAAIARLNRSGVRWVLIGNAPSDASRFADLHLESAGAPVRLLDEVRDWATFPVDLGALRSRWSAITEDPRYSSELMPRRSRRERAVLWIERRAPGSRGVARAIGRRLGVRR